MLKINEKCVILDQNMYGELEEGNGFLFRRTEMKGNRRCVLKRDQICITHVKLIDLSMCLNVWLILCYRYQIRGMKWGKGWSIGN